MTARRHAQHPGGEPVNAGTSTPVAAKAAAIDAAQARPLTWKTVVRRALAVVVAGAAIYLVLPKLIAVLGAWPRLSTLNPVWFTVCLAAELVSFTCNFALQRLALRTKDWFPVVTAGLTGNAVTNSLPGASAAGARRPRSWPELPVFLITARIAGSRRQVNGRRSRLRSVAPEAACRPDGEARPDRRAANLTARTWHP